MKMEMVKMIIESKVDQNSFRVKVNNNSNYSNNKINSLCESIENNNKDFRIDSKENNILLTGDQFEAVFGNLISEINNSIDSLDFKLTEKLNCSVESKKLQESIKTLNKNENETSEMTFSMIKFGKKRLNVNEEIKFKDEKKRSFKNLLSFFISPLKYISRMSLPIKTNKFNKEINKELGEYKLENKNHNRKEVEFFSKRFNELNSNFEKNIARVESKKNEAINKENRSLLIKYHTLEKTLEYKFLSDIKKLKSELVSDLIESKFNTITPKLLKEIKNYLDSKLSKESNYDISNLFYDNTINDLKDILKNVINDSKRGVYFDDAILTSVRTVIKEDNLIDYKGDNLSNVKNEISKDIIKELFNNISSNESFIDEGELLSKVDLLTKKFKNEISKNMGEVNNEIISKLNENFYNNIKKSGNGHDLLTRLFKNTSNNINYKWAQDAVVLLISYETFSNQDLNIKKYNNSGVANIGGSGSHLNKLSSLQLDLQSIFNRLGLDTNDLEKSKDEVMRKYFANYFEHI